MNNAATNMVTIEEGKRLSNSILWQWQKNYYDSQGINAWVSQIPFEVTSNPFIANSYAHIAVAFIRDYLASKPESVKDPFYFIELGTGSGKFSFYAIKSILDLLKLAGMDQVKINYIMSDFTNHNIQYYKTHPALLPFINAGVIDFAIFDMESRNPVKLEISNITLDNKILTNPLIAFANYVFDTTSYDAYTINQNTIRELLITIKTDKSNMSGNNVNKMENLQISFSPADIENVNYSNEGINNVLNEYKTIFKKTSVLMPTGAMNAIQYLTELSSNQLLLISTDKGNSSIDSLENQDHPVLTFHDTSCFSMMVNYHALALYFKINNGDAFLETSRDVTLETGVFLSGFKFSDLHETNIAIEHYIEETSPCDYYKLDKRIRESYRECDLDTLATHLSLSHWDPAIYAAIADRVESLIPTADKELTRFLAKNMPKVAGNYYYMPRSEPTLFHVGYFFHLLQKYDDAIQYYEKALPFEINLFYIHYNLGLCYYAQGNNEKALEHLHSALGINPDSIDTKNMIESISSEVSG